MTGDFARPGPTRGLPLRDDRGAVLALGAMALTVAIGSAALASDFAYLYLLRRELQKAADGAALSAALALPDVDRSEAAARRSVDTALAGAPPAVAVVFGAYRPGDADDRVTPARDRFLAGAGDADAVRVELAATRSTLIGAVLGRPSAALSASAVAIGADPTASLRLSSGLATVDSDRSAMLDAVFSGFLGGSVALSAATWQGLADIEIALLDYLDAVAADAGLAVAATDSLLSADLAVRSLFAVAADVVKAGGGPAGAQAALAFDALAARADPDATVTLGDLVVVDEAAAPLASGSPVAVDGFRLAASLAQAAAESVGPTGPSAPVDAAGAAVTVETAVVEAPRLVHRGGIGAFVRTAQTRVLLTVETAVDPDVGLGLGTVALRVPIYLELGGGSVEVVDIVCTGDRALDLAARSAAADLYAADIDPGTAFGPGPLAPDPVTIAFVELAGIEVVALDLYGHYPVASGEGAVTVAGPFDAPRSMRVETTGIVGDPVGDLLSTLTLEARLLPGLPLPGPTVDALLDAVTAELGTILGAVSVALASALDPSVDALAEALGADLGYADVDVLGVDCARARLAA